MTTFAPPTPQPAATRDGVGLDPLAGGFLPPYAERLDLISAFPALSAEAMGAALLDDGSDADESDTAGSEPDGPNSGGRAAGTPFGGDAMAAMDAFNAPFGEAEETRATAEDREVDGPHGPVPVRVYRPEPGLRPPPPSPAAGGLRAGLVWYHGGAFIGGDLDMPEADAVARGLATRTGATIVSVAYRLCNDGLTHHPVPHDDAWAAYLWTREHAAELGIDPGRLAVGGASAGANLAAGVALRGRDDGAAPWQALLAYPVVHAEHWPAPSGELAARLADMPQILRFPTDIMALINENYLGGPVRDAPPCAFVGDGNGTAADLTSYPPAYIENCENDDLRASGEAFARQLSEAGADVEVVTAAGVPHGHLNAVGSPLTSRSLDRFAARLARAA